MALLRLNHKRAVGFNLWISGYVLPAWKEVLAAILAVAKLAIPQGHTEQEVEEYTTVNVECVTELPQFLGGNGLSLAWLVRRPDLDEGNAVVLVEASNRVQCCLDLMICFAFTPGLKSPEFS